jgi:hypothetical protein
LRLLLPLLLRGRGLCARWPLPCPAGEADDGEPPEAPEDEDEAEDEPPDVDPGFPSMTAVPPAPPPPPALPPEPGWIGPLRLFRAFWEPPPRFT